MSLSTAGSSSTAHKCMHEQLVITTNNDMYELTCEAGVPCILMNVHQADDVC